jgi:hypothetical protein
VALFASFTETIANERLGVGGLAALEKAGQTVFDVFPINVADPTVFIGLLILGVPLAPALAAVVFIGAFIPVIGAPVATFFAAIVALAEKGPLIAVLVIVLTIIVGSFDGDVMQPLVMGKAVNIHPLAIVVLIAAGSLTLGIIGAFIAVPVGSAIYGVFKFLSGRDPEHPRPWAWGAPGVDPDQPEFVAPVAAKKRRFWHRKKKQTA